MLFGISKAIEAYGGLQRLGDALGVSRQAVWKWQQRGWVPLDRALEIEKLCGVPRGELVKPAIAAALLSN